MSLAIYYADNCEGGVTPYQCSPCPVREKAGVTSVAFIKSTYAFVDPTDAAEWIDGIESGDILLIPRTRGDYDGGTPKYGDGYGRIKQRLLGYDYKLNFNDEDFIANQEFYDTIDDSNNWKMAWFTETLVWLTDAQVTVAIKDTVDIDIEKDVVWMGEVQWFYKNKPLKYTAPVGIAESCIGLSEA